MGSWRYCIRTWSTINVIVNHLAMFIVGYNLNLHHEHFLVVKTPHKSDSVSLVIDEDLDAVFWGRRGEMYATLFFLY